MSKKTIKQSHRNSEKRVPAQGMDRRSFLRATAASATALTALPIIGTPDATATPTSSPYQQGGDGSGGGGGGGQNGGPQGPPDPLITTTLSNLVETWNEPWVWRPSDWPGQQLHLNVVENENPGNLVGFGNPGAVLFSYGGNTPGPTIRMRGNETLFVKLRNMLGQNFGSTVIGPNPDANELVPGLEQSAVTEKVTRRPDYCLGEHTNGQHAAHVTNLHVHGLHVRPGLNPNDTHSDNVILRVMSKGDFSRRQTRAQEPECDFLRDLTRSGFLRDDEVVGEANYEFRIGDVFGDPEQPHPPGTHWYHPHSHGATHNQVASGMAGFLVVEGDVDDAINLTMTDGDLELAGNLAASIATATPTNPNMDLKVGPYDYRERLIFMQRVVAQFSQDQDAPPQSQQLKAPPQAAVNGNPDPMLITMRPGAVERWRVLNGSVDGRGFKRFMVMEGQIVLDPNNGNQLASLTQLGETATLTPLPLFKSSDNSPDFEDLKQQLYLLAFDGVTLVTGNPYDGWRYSIKDLAPNDSYFPNPLTEVATKENPNAAMEQRIANCYKSEESLKGCYNRPNEVFLAPANRADVFFQAPDDIAPPFTLSDMAASLPNAGTEAVSPDLIEAFAANGVDLPSDAQATVTSSTKDSSGNTVATGWRIDSPLDAPPFSPPTYLLSLDTSSNEITVTEFKIYTIVAKTSIVSGDSYQQSLQRSVANNSATLASPPEDIVLAHIVVSGAHAVDESGERFDVMSLNEVLPEVPPYHLPVEDWELEISKEEAEARSDVTAGDYRTRTVTYSGWGSQDYPLVTTASTDTTAENFRAFVENDQANHNGVMENVIYAQPVIDGAPLEDNGEPVYVLMPSDIRSMAIDGRKFNPNDPLRPRLLVDSAEDWVLYNDSMMLWGDTNPDNQPPGQYKGHYVSYPVDRVDGEAAFNDNPQLQIVTKSVDHPFHIHQNPFWVISVEIRDENGALHNILPEPRWQDVVWIPRNAGRVVFRSRFPDYVGRYVNHCHILLHEDNGMMTALDATPYMDETNYVSSPFVVSADEGQPPTSDAINDIYQPPSLEDAYRQSTAFIDNNPMRSQEYPGFEVLPPEA